MVEGILKGMDKKNNIDGMRASILSIFKWNFLFALLMGGLKKGAIIHMLWEIYKKCIGIGMG
jgi:hypothetical protein